MAQNILKIGRWSFVGVLDGFVVVLVVWFFWLIMHL